MCLDYYDLFHKDIWTRDLTLQRERERDRERDGQRRRETGREGCNSSLGSAAGRQWANEGPGGQQTQPASSAVAQYPCRENRVHGKVRFHLPLCHTLHTTLTHYTHTIHSQAERTVEQIPIEIVFFFCQILFTDTTEGRWVLLQVLYEQSSTSSLYAEQYEQSSTSSLYAEQDEQSVSRAELAVCSKCSVLVYVHDVVW